MTAELTGTYLTLDDGRPAVRFSRTYDHPIERVWHFVTDADELAGWFPFRAVFDLRPGGLVTFPDDPEMAELPGTVIAVDPPRHVSYVWDEDELHFDLEEIDDKRTRFTLTNVLGSEGTAARTSAGWEMCLEALDAKARGERYEEPHAGVTAPWQGVYDRYVAAGFPSGAPIPGTDT